MIVRQEALKVSLQASLIEHEHMVQALAATNTGINDVFRLPGIVTCLRRQVDMASGVATIAEAAQETGDGTETATNNLCNGSPAWFHHAGDVHGSGFTRTFLYCTVLFGSWP